MRMVEWANEQFELGVMANYEIQYLIDDMLEAIAYGTENQKETTTEALQIVSRYLLDYRPSL